MDTTVSLDWNEAAVRERLTRELLLRTRIATDYVWSTTRDNINVPVVRDNRGNVERSSPGEFPRRDTGLLQNTLAQFTYVANNEIVGVVQSVEDYAPPLESGTEKMEPRSFLRRTLLETRVMIRQMIVGRKIR